MIKFRFTMAWKGLLIVVGLFLAQNTDASVTINNDIPAGTIGELEIVMDTGGESNTGYITGQGTPSGTLHSHTSIIYDYYSYIDVGNNGGGFRLNGGSAPVAGGNDSASSSGSFTGSGGNTINYGVVSSIPDGGDALTSVFTFSAASGTLGTFRFLQYLDEDVLNLSDNVFFTTGSAAADDLELFTLSNAEAIGISHGGAYSAAGGLANASFAGWASDNYNDIQARITGSGQPVSPTGVNNIGSSFNHPEISPIIGGPVFGPIDVVSVLAWDVDPNASSATIITSFGGVPEVGDIDPVIPEPGAFVVWSLLGLTVGGAGWWRRRRGTV